jgi:hypothetical protein
MHNSDEPVVSLPRTNSAMIAHVSGADPIRPENGTGQLFCPE